MLSYQHMRGGNGGDDNNDDERNNNHNNHMKKINKDSNLYLDDDEEEMIIIDQDAHLHDLVCGLPVPSHMRCRLEQIPPVPGAPKKAHKFTSRRLKRLGLPKPFDFKDNALTRRLIFIDPLEPVPALPPLPRRKTVRRAESHLHRVNDTFARRQLDFDRVEEISPPSGAANVPEPNALLNAPRKSYSRRAIYVRGGNAEPQQPQAEEEDLEMDQEEVLQPVGDEQPMDMDEGQQPQEAPVAEAAVAANIPVAAVAVEAVAEEPEEASPAPRANSPATPAHDNNADRAVVFSTPMSAPLPNYRPSPRAAPQPRRRSDGQVMKRRLKF